MVETLYHRYRGKCSTDPSGRSKVLCPKVSAITPDAVLPDGYVLRKQSPHT